MKIKGPRFLQVLSPCPLGWSHDAAKTIEVSRLAVETGLFPLLELEHGSITSVMRLARQKPVEDYLTLQGRFKHLFGSEEGAAEVRHIQALADAHIRRYRLFDADTEWTTDTANEVQRHGRGGYAAVEKVNIDG